MQQVSCNNEWKVFASHLINASIRELAINPQPLTVSKQMKERLDTFQLLDIILHSFINRVLKEYIFRINTEKLPFVSENCLQEVIVFYKKFSEFTSFSNGTV